MFLDESAFDMDDDYPSNRTNTNTYQKQSYNNNNNSKQLLSSLSVLYSLFLLLLLSLIDISNGQKNNSDLAIVLDDEMEDLSIGGLGSAGGIGTTSASRARFLAQQRELNLKKQQQKIAQSGKILLLLYLPLFFINFFSLFF